MILTPLDVQQKTFGTALRGYDLDEVDAFLDNVVQTLKSYEDRLAESANRQAALEAEVAKHTETGDQISRALLTAQRSADQIVDEAKADAARLIEDARLRAEEVAAKRELERARLQIEVDNIRMGIAELRTRVGGLVESMQTDLDSMERAAAQTEAQFTFEDREDQHVRSPAPADGNGDSDTIEAEEPAGEDDQSMEDHFVGEEQPAGEEAPTDEEVPVDEGDDAEEEGETQLYDQEMDEGWSDSMDLFVDDTEPEGSDYGDVTGPDEEVLEELPVRNPGDWSKVDDRSSSWSRTDLDDIEPYRPDH